MATPERAAEMLRGRLLRNRRHLGRWAKREGVTCWRVYDRDIPDVPVTIDDYEGRLVLADARSARVGEELDPAWLEAVVAVTGELLAPRELHVKERRRMSDRRTTGAQYQRLGDAGAWHEVGEGGRRFLVNLEDYLDTGLFLDHRVTRAMVAAEAAGKRFLNLFAYTGAFTVHAAAAGAASSVSVDMSNTYLDWAGENLARNRLDAGRHQLERADVLAWLGAYRGPRFDLVVVDPPTFSNSKKMTASFDVLRDHVALLAAVARVATPDAVLWFSTNHRQFRLDPRAGGARVAEELTARTVPPDFAHSRPHRSWRLAPAARDGGG
ncbi:MAG TPA: class I SAM-dependent methyltransferase [Kofleriaceae bacterium]|nr:class I SAM-dependent methyltransferase [Kofleriaceae bacterium]